MSKWRSGEKSTRSFDSQIASIVSSCSFFAIILFWLGKELYALLTILISGSIAAKFIIQHRIKHKWHWSKPRRKELLKSIGSTLFRFFLVATVTVNLYQSGWRLDNFFNPLKVFRELIEIFPQLTSNPEQIASLGMPVFFTVISFIKILYDWKILYSTEEEF